jgi:hypothetical protein
MEYGCKKVDPHRLENTKALKSLRRIVPDVTWDKIIRIVDGAIEDKVSDDITQLTWCCTGSMLGEDSSRPHGDINYIWNKISEKMGDERLSSITVGTLVQWRISLRDEEWYCNRVPTDTWDDISQCYIAYYQYWIKPE